MWMQAKWFSASHFSWRLAFESVVFPARTCLASSGSFNGCALDYGGIIVLSDVDILMVSSCWGTLQ